MYLFPKSFDNLLKQKYNVTLLYLRITQWQDEKRRVVSVVSRKIVSRKL